MDDILNFQINFSDKKQSLLLNLSIQAFLCIPFSINALFVASTANAGFNIVLTALINSGFAAAGLHVLQKGRSQLSIGILMGCSMMITILSLMTAIYWGQLSKCEMTNYSISQYTCTNKLAYGAISALATLIFVIQIVFTGFLFSWGSEFIDQTLNQNKKINQSLPDSSSQIIENYSNLESPNDSDSGKFINA